MNGRPLRREDLHRELIVRNHDVICESGALTWLLGPNYRNAVKSFDALKDDAHYVTARSTEHAWRIHIENLDKGAVDFEPLRPALVLVGSSAVIGAVLSGVAAIISAAKHDKSKPAH